MVISKKELKVVVIKYNFKYNLDNNLRLNINVIF